MNEKCGTQRATGGGLNDEAGRHSEFDALASKFFLAASDARSSVYQEAVSLAKTAGSAGQQYLKVMEKVVNGSGDYLQKESSRYVNISRSISRLIEKKIA